MMIYDSYLDREKEIEDNGDLN